MTERKLVSIICPVFNEEKSLPIFYKRLKSTLSPLASRYDFELLFTNNRSTDDTLEIISALHQQDPMGTAKPWWWLMLIVKTHLK